MLRDTGAPDHALRYAHPLLAAVVQLLERAEEIADDRRLLLQLRLHRRGCSSAVASVR